MFLFFTWVVNCQYSLYSSLMLHMSSQIMVNDLIILISLLLQNVFLIKRMIPLLIHHMSICTKEIFYFAIYSPFLQVVQINQYFLQLIGTVTSNIEFFISPIYRGRISLSIRYYDKQSKEMIYKYRIWNDCFRRSLAFWYYQSIIWREL